MDIFMLQMESKDFLPDMTNLTFSTSMTKPAKFFLIGVLSLLTLMADQSAEAQISGVALRSPPLTHALLNDRQSVLGTGITYTSIENPPYMINDIEPESITTTQTLGFFGTAISERWVVAASYSPTLLKIRGKRNSGSEKEDVVVTTTTSEYLFYLIPTLIKGQTNRLALIWGKGRRTIEANEALDQESTSWDVGTTGLVAEIFLGRSFSVIPWASWNYLLFDISPFDVADDIGKPDYGIEGVIHAGGLKISLTFIAQSLDTADRVENEEDEPEQTNNDADTSVESYSLSFSYTF